MNADELVFLALALFFLICPLRKRNSLVGMLYDPIRVYLARLGLNHTAWTMFSSGTNRNHFLKVRLNDINSEQKLEIRDPWKLGGLAGDLIDERLRRIVLVVIRADTGPLTRKTLAEGLVRWCLRHRIKPPFREFDGEAVYGQEVFKRLKLISGKNKAELVTKFVIRFRVAGDGRLSFFD